MPGAGTRFTEVAPCAIPSPRPSIAWCRGLCVGKIVGAFRPVVLSVAEDVQALGGSLEDGQDTIGLCSKPVPEIGIALGISTDVHPSHAALSFKEVSDEPDPSPRR
jgi:hypothetical protein